MGTLPRGQREDRCQPQGERQRNVRREFADVAERRQAGVEQTLYPVCKRTSGGAAVPRGNRHDAHGHACNEKTTLRHTTAKTGQAQCRDH